MIGRFLLFAGLVFSSVSCASTTALWVFTAPWDLRSDSALAAGVSPEASVVTGWIALDSLGALPAALFADSASAGRASRFALVTSYRGNRFHPEAVRVLAADAAQRSRVADEIERLIRAGSYRGAVLDFESLETRDSLDIAIVAGALAAAARRGGAVEVALAVPALDTVTFAPHLLLPRVDYLLVMLYDQHWLGSSPGPVAARGWARDALARWVALVGADRVVAALPTYGYHWRPDAPTDVIGWSDLQRLARDSGADIQRDSASGSLRLRMDRGGEAWLPDAVVVGQMLEDVKALQVPRVALWRLGLEDPALWTVLGQR